MEKTTTGSAAAQPGDLDSTTTAVATPPSVVSTSDPATITSDSHCHILDTPPEIRNRIYDYVFAVDTNTTIALEVATAPPKALVATCHQVRDEAKAMCNSAYRRYWSENEFSITHSGPDTTITERDHMYEVIDRQDDRDLRHIPKMTIRDTTCPEFHWAFENLLWTKRGVPKGETSVVEEGQYMVIPFEMQDAMVDAGFVPSTTPCSRYAHVVHFNPDLPTRIEKARRMIDWKSYSVKEPLKYAVRTGVRHIVNGHCNAHNVGPDLAVEIPWAEYAAQHGIAL